jgi:hypothetical protein
VSILSSAAKYGFALGVGFLLGKTLTDVPYFTLKREVDLFGGWALLLTAIISIVLVRPFEKAKYSDQVRKNAVMTRLDECLALVRLLEELCARQEFAYTDAVALVRKARLTFKSFMGFAANLEHPISLELRNKAILTYAQLHDLLTEQAPLNHPSPPLLVRNLNGVPFVTLSDNRRVEVERALDQAKETLYSVQEGVILTTR